MTNPTVPAKYKTTDRNCTVKIGRHSIIGCTSVILPGVIIEKGCAVGAMTLCNKSLKAFGIYGGVPAKMLKEREREREKKEYIGFGKTTYGRDHVDAFRACSKIYGPLPKNCSHC